MKTYIHFVREIIANGCLELDIFFWATNQQLSELTDIFLSLFRKLRMNFSL